MENGVKLNTLSFKEIKKQADNISLCNENNIIVVSRELKNDSRKNVQKLGERLLKRFSDYSYEIERTKNMYEFDMSFGQNKLIAGIDEVGRGPLAGPIVCAAVMFDLSNTNACDYILNINDSKKLSSKMREELSLEIINKALCYSIAAIDNKVIDIKGIGWCNQEVFRMACHKLKIKPQIVLSDGYPVRELNIDNTGIVKGDCKSASIAAASIVAKVYRDNLMKEYSKKYANYDFENNVGYGTKKHIIAIQKYGLTEIHRKSFLKNIISEKHSL